MSLLLLGGLAWVRSFRDFRMFKWEQLEERPQRGAALLSDLLGSQDRSAQGWTFRVSVPAQHPSLFPLSMILLHLHTPLPLPRLVPPKNEGQKGNVYILTGPPIQRPCSAWASDTVSCKPVPTSA